MGPYARWVTDPSAFPACGGMNGVQVLADCVYSLGMKFGIYVTPGISKQAAKKNTPIAGTRYTADQIAGPTVREANYNCGGMVRIDYSKPGAQQFIDSWADMLAGWGGVQKSIAVWRRASICEDGGERRRDRGAVPYGRKTEADFSTSFCCRTGNGLARLLGPQPVVRPGEKRRRHDSLNPSTAWGCLVSHSCA